MHLGFFYLHEPEIATGGVTNLERSHNRQSEMEWVRVNVRTIGELNPICPWIPIIGYHFVVTSSCSFISTGEQVGIGQRATIFAGRGIYFHLNGHASLNSGSCQTHEEFSPRRSSQRSKPPPRRSRCASRS
jgi:hypothetical protein